MDPAAPLRELAHAQTSTLLDSFTAEQRAAIFALFERAWNEVLTEAQREAARALGETLDLMSAHALERVVAGLRLPS